MSSIAQQALDLSAGVSTRIINGSDPASKSNMQDLATAIQLLAQNALSATPSTDNPDPSATLVDVSSTLAASDPQPGT